MLCVLACLAEMSRRQVSAASLGGKYLRRVNSIAPASTWMVRYSISSRSHLARKQELPKSWSKWRDDKRSLCWMIQKKVALPVGVDRKSYWEAMILGITNDKFCSLRANFKQ